MSLSERISLLPWEQEGYEAPKPTFRVELDERFFLIQLVGGFVRFRELCAKHRRQPSQWNFAIRERVAEDSAPGENILRSLFEDGWRRGRYGRIVCLNSPDVVFLGCNGTGFICAPSYRSYGKESGTVEFRFSKEGDFDSHPARYWREEVEAWDADEDSDFRFALGLASEDDRNGIARRVCSIDGGGWPEMERIARLILRVDARWNDAKCASFEVPGVEVQLKRGAVAEIALVTAYGDSYGPEHRLIEFWCQKVSFQPSALWQFWLRHFVRGFDEAKLRRKAAGKWVRECNFVITDERRESSAHERLEAMLHLRDWLRDKLPPAEIESLLR